MTNRLDSRIAMRGVILLTPLALAVSDAFAASKVEMGTLDPLTIPKYVTPLVIPPVMNKALGATTNDYDIAVRQFKQQILPGGIWNTINGRTDAFLPTLVWSYGPDVDPKPDSSDLGGGVGIAPAPNSQFNYPAYTIETISNLPYVPGKAVTVDWINDLVADPWACKTVQVRPRTRRAITSATCCRSTARCTGPTPRLCPASKQDVDQGLRPERGEDRRGGG